VKSALVIVCLLVCGAPAVAQSGVSNQRDQRGNLVRDNGGYSTTGVNQGPVNNGPIKNAPAQPPINNVGIANDKRIAPR